MGKLTYRAPAKINLALSVGEAVPSGPRKGWHEIASWMACLDLSDTVTVVPRPITSHRIVWAPDAPKPTPIDWPIEKDLAVRAHRALEERAGRPLDCVIKVEKRIPVGGGLGGGSSDAAATLLAVREVFDLAISDEELAEIGATLGSDVPFFLDVWHRPGVVSGFGERVVRTKAVNGALDEVLLIIPPFGCGTPEVYRAFDSLGKRGGPDIDRVMAMSDGPLAPAVWFNDLEPAAERVAPTLAMLRTEVAQVLGTRVMMTGSGSTLVAWNPSAVNLAKLRARVCINIEATKAMERCVFVTSKLL